MNMPTYDSEIVQNIIHQSRTLIHKKDNGEITSSELKSSLVKLVKSEVSKDAN